MDNDHKNLLIELYKENQKFIDKGLFTVPSLSIPLLLNYSPHINDNSSWVLMCFFWSLGFFILTIIIQLAGCFIAKIGCNLLLKQDKDKQKTGSNYFNWAEKINYLCLITFSLALVLVLLTIILNRNN